MIELQDIFRQYGEEHRQCHPLSAEQAKAMRAIIACRTAALGAHVDQCDECGYERISYNSCRNRHCPKCQTFAKEEWLDRQRQNLLNTRYFHVVFTLPDNLHPICLRNPRRLYDILFKAASQTLLELCADPKYLGATPGITAILHTWGQNLHYHPHLHCVVTGGGLADGFRWISSRRKFFLPIKVLSRKFRGKFLYYLRQAMPDLPAQTVELLYRKDWVLYCKPPFGDAGKVMDYLGRYTHRVAISNNRLIKLEGGRVFFRWRDYSDGNRVKVMSLAADEFLRRFLMHILPSGFRKIRHFGLVASRNKSKRLVLCRWLTRTRTPAPPIHVSDRLTALFGEDFNRCPCCRTGHLCRGAPSAKTA